MYEDKKNDVCNFPLSLNECENKPHKPNVSIGKIYTKVPVVLAELTLQANLDACIKFPKPVLEIKDVKKQIKLVQCRLLLPTDKLFVKGFVRKNIQYASPMTEPECNLKTLSSSINSLTVDVPFSCVTEIKHYLRKPVQPSINKRSEFDFLISESLPSGFPEKDEFLSSDLSQFHQNSTQYYNELPFCELVSSNIIEWDEAIDRTDLLKDAPIGEGVFTQVEEKMVVDITLKVLQNQQIRVSSTTNDDCDDFC
ncbi:CsxC family protein [Solibacillus silvestris]|uniref:CsxC family protein n=1 Tax=Solibacillus silvestris TaxID=76853 RepID=UPI003F80A06A